MDKVSSGVKSELTVRNGAAYLVKCIFILLLLMLCLGTAGAVFMVFRHDFFSFNVRDGLQFFIAWVLPLILLGGWYSLLRQVKVWFNGEKNISKETIQKAPYFKNRFLSFLAGTSPLSDDDKITVGIRIFNILLWGIILAGILYKYYLDIGQYHKRDVFYHLKFGVLVLLGAAYFWFKYKKHGSREVVLLGYYCLKFYLFMFFLCFSGGLLFVESSYGGIFRTILECSLVGVIFCVACVGIVELNVAFFRNIPSQKGKISSKEKFNCFFELYLLIWGVLLLYVLLS